MITQKLLDYIKKQLSSGVNSESIRTSLLQSGWNPDDVKVALNSTGEAQTPVSVVNITEKPKKKSHLLLWIGLILLTLIIIGMYFIGVPLIRYRAYVNQIDKVVDIQKSTHPYTPPNYVITDIAKKEEIAYGVLGVYTRMKDSSSSKNDYITISMAPIQKWTCPNKGTRNQIGSYNVCVTHMSVGYWYIWDKNGLTIKVVSNNDTVPSAELEKVVQSL